MTNYNSLPMGVLLLTATLAASASADALKLPDSALNDDTFLVVTWDTTCAKPADVLAVAKAIEGDRTKDLQQAVAGYKEAYDRLTGAGLSSASLVYHGDSTKTGKTSVVLCLRLAPGADRAKLENAVKAEAGDRLASWDLTSEKDFLLLRPKGAAKGPEPTPARRALFDEAAGRNPKGLSLVFMPTEAMRQMPHVEQPANEFPEVTEVVRLLAINSNWLRIELDVGPPATFEVTARPKDSNGAGLVVDAFKKAASVWKAQTGNVGELEGLYGIAAEGAPLLGDDMGRPGFHESRVSFAAKGKSLGGVAVMLDLAVDPLMKSLPTGDKP